MPIHLQTGLPGSAKTLRMLVYIKELSERENRPVYYHNITDLKLSWNPLENPKLWYELPEGAIIVFDECQDLFPVHETKLASQEYVLQLAKHRHRGYDIFMISQHPMNIHAFVRRLTDKHWHNIRAFGMKGSTVHEWNRVIDYPEKVKKDSTKSIFNFPKDAFNYYKSAEIHTIQRKIPKRIYWLIPVILLVPTFIYIAYTKLSPEANKARIEKQMGQEVLDSSDPKQNGTNINQNRGEGKILNYIEAHQPQIPDMPFTAPIYNELVQPTQAPYPAACITMRNVCKCYTQQGTKLNTSESVCMQIVENGLFLEWQQNSNSPERLSNNKAVYSARNADSDFTNAQGMTSRSSPNNAPAI